MIDEEKWSEWSYDCKVASGQFFDGPGWVKKITLTADGVNPTSVAFYDGHSTIGTHKVTLRAAVRITINNDYEIPFKVEQGLYAETEVDVDCVSVQYKKDKP